MPSKHTNVSIPFSLARRLGSIVSDPVTLEERFKELKMQLQKQNYPDNLFTSRIDKARAITIDEARTVQDKHDEEVIAYVSPLNPRNREMFGQIRDSLNKSS